MGWGDSVVEHLPTLQETPSSTPSTMGSGRNEWQTTCREIVPDLVFCSIKILVVATYGFYSQKINGKH